MSDDEYDDEVVEEKPKKARKPHVKGGYVETKDTGGSLERNKRMAAYFKKLYEDQSLIPGVMYAPEANLHVSEALAAATEPIQSGAQAMKNLVGVGKKSAERIDALIEAEKKGVPMSFKEPKVKDAKPEDFALFGAEAPALASADANHKIADYLEALAQTEPDFWKKKAYGKASAAVRTANFVITSGKQAQKTLAGVGKGTAALIDEFLATGTISAVAKGAPLEGRSKVLLELQRLHGMTAVRSAQLFDAGIGSLADLRAQPTLMTPAEKIALQHLAEFEQPTPVEEAEKLVSYVATAVAAVEKTMGSRLVVRLVNKSLLDPRCAEIKGALDIVIQPTLPPEGGAAAAAKSGKKAKGSSASAPVELVDGAVVLQSVVEQLKGAGIITDILSVPNDTFFTAAIRLPGGKASKSEGGDVKPMKKAATPSVQSAVVPVVEGGEFDVPDEEELEAFGAGSGGAARARENAIAARKAKAAAAEKAAAAAAAEGVLPPKPWHRLAEIRWVEDVFDPEADAEMVNEEAEKLEKARIRKEKAAAKKAKAQMLAEEGDDDDIGLGEEEPEPQPKAKKAAPKKRKSKKDESEEDEDEDEEEEEAKPKKKGKRALPFA